MHNDQIYIQYLKENNSNGIQLIYNKYSKQIVTMIQQNNGSEDDAFDILQESLVNIYHMAVYRDFELTTSFGAFLLMVCKRKWLNVLKKNGRIPVTKLEQSVLYVEDESNRTWEEMIEKVEKENKVMALLNTLGESCQQIIKRCMTEKHQEKIAESMGISYAYLRKKKSECMATLAKKVKESGLF